MMEGGGETSSTPLYKVFTGNNQTNNIGEHTHKDIRTASNWLEKLNNIITTLYSDLSTQEAKEKENINRK